MFRLAHLSDVHLGPLPPVSQRELMSKRIAGYVNWQRNRHAHHLPMVVERLVADLLSRSPDHVAVTGDLINLGLESEMEQAARFLHSLGEPAAVSAICGNHDAYVPGALNKALAAWQPFVAGDHGVAGEGDAMFPTLRRRDGISIIGCNSARATMPFMATGFFRKPQAERLAQMLEREGRQGQCRVVLIHHPPVRGAVSAMRRLVGQTLFRRVILEQGAELVLHGHTHLASINRIPGGKNGVAVVGVPSAGQAPVAGRRKPAAGYNLFTIGQGPRGWSIAMNEYGMSDTGLSIGLVGKRQLL